MSKSKVSQLVEKVQESEELNPTPKEEKFQQKKYVPLTQEEKIKKLQIKIEEQEDEGVPVKGVTLQEVKFIQSLPIAGYMERRLYIGRYPDLVGIYQLPDNRILIVRDGWPYECVWAHMVSSTISKQAYEAFLKLKKHG